MDFETAFFDSSRLGATAAVGTFTSLRSGVCILGLTAAIALSPARAETTISSNVLTLTTVSLDPGPWKRAEDEIDKDGDRNFYAEHRDDEADMSVGVSETKLANPNEPARSVAERFVRGMKERATFFELRDCPRDYSPNPNWICVAYDIGLKQPKATALSVVHVATRAGYKIIKRVRIGVDASERARGDAVAAFKSIELKP